jgi:protocatechuate 4,5-dioxygenase alpha chain
LTTPVPLAAPPLDLIAPGTTIYDGPLSTRGLRLNRFCLSLKIPANRERFLADERAYASAHGLTESEVRAVLGRDWTGLLAAGGHLQAVLKLAATVGCDLYHIGGHALGISAQAMHAACPRIVSGEPRHG